MSSSSSKEAFMKLLRVIYGVILIILIFAGLNQPVHSSEYKYESAAIVDRVLDGDTIKVRLHDGRVEKVRIYYIDAPEYGIYYSTERVQPFGFESYIALDNLIRGKEVLLKHNGKRTYGRLLASVYIDDTSVAEHLVSEGLAWHWERYSDSTVLSDLQNKAQLKGVGIWSHSEPLEPWKFRRLN
ncbi:MAG: thermonuclease family protein [Methyloprofundus sp.]|nr:thermonuclease family protein [Methyloprofundus sp.]